MSRELISCRALEVGYSGRALLPPIELTVRSGEFWAVIGRNGAGKTTWLRTVLGLIEPVQGRVERDVLRASYLPQRSAADELWPLSAYDVVEMGTERGRSFLKPRDRAARERIQSALDAMGVGNLAALPYRQLSEGQKQRVMLARLAASDADLAILDEPTSAMDVVAEREALGLLERLRRERGTAVLVVSHFLAVARRFADHAILLDRDLGVVVVGTPDDVFKHEAFVMHFAEDDKHA